MQEKALKTKLVRNNILAAMKNEGREAKYKGVHQSLLVALFFSTSLVMLSSDLVTILICMWSVISALIAWHRELR